MGGEAELRSSLETGGVEMMEEGLSTYFSDFEVQNRKKELHGRKRSKTLETQAAGSLRFNFLNSCLSILRRSSFIPASHRLTRPISIPLQEREGATANL